MNTERNTTLLPRLEKMSTAAAARRIEASTSTTTRRAGRNGLRLLGVGLATLAISGTAVAAVAGWHPSIGDQGPGGSPSISEEMGVPGEMKAALGVLDRPSTAQDHGPEVEATLTSVGKDLVDGVRTDSIRFLAPGPGGRASVLMVTDQTNIAPGLAPGIRIRETIGSADAPSLCVFHPIPISGEPFAGGGYCFGLREVMGGSAVASAGGPNGTYVDGLVPDGVASVKAYFPDGSTKTVIVKNNFYEFNSDKPSWGPTRTIWFDADGHKIENPREAPAKP